MQLTERVCGIHPAFAALPAAASFTADAAAEGRSGLFGTASAMATDATAMQLIEMIDEYAPPDAPVAGGT